MPDAAEPSRRLFIGLMAPPPVREAVLAWRDRWRWPRGASLAAPAHLHLTLFFLGDTAEARLPALQAALGRVGFEPFSLRLGRPQLWPRGLAVLRPEPQPQLDALHQRMAQALQAAGWTDAGAGRWRPHLTLARRAAEAEPPADAPQFDWAVDGFSLVWSRLPPQVPRAVYEPLAHWST